MFAKDYNLLNELYNQKIAKENLGLGPQADNAGVTPTTVRVKKISIPPEPGCDKCGENEEHCEYAAKGCTCNHCPECVANQKKEKSEDCEGHNPETYDSNGKMARQLLFRMVKLSAMLHDLLKGKDNVEAWVLSKITNAHDQLNSVFGYEDYENAMNPMQGTCGEMGGDMQGNLEENNEEDLYSAISKGGDDLLNQLKTVLRRESRDTLEKVLFETITLLEKK